MDVLEAIKNRHSTRSFLEKTPSEDTVRVLLEAAIRAPSAGNIQPWHFYVVRNHTVRRALSEAALGQRHVSGAPVVIVVCTHPEQSKSRYGKRGARLYCLQDAAAAAENLILAATGMGLGACWVGAFDERRVADCLSMPSGRRPVALIAVGYSSGTPALTSRNQINRVSTYIE